MAGGGFEIIDEAFRRLLGPAPELIEVASGFAFSEGTCYVPQGDFFVWSDIPNDRIHRWSERDGLGLFRQGAGKANGNTVDGQGRVLSCETAGRQVSIAEADGRLVGTLVDRYQGRRLTSPNDIVVKSDGSIWFTDPDYGAIDTTVGHGQPAEQTANRVYRLEPASGQLTALAEDFDKPNGLCFSPDERRLYISDSGATHGADRPHHVRLFDVIDGRRLANGQLFAEITPHVPDGMRVDAEGNLYVTAGDGVQVFAPDGRPLGKILTPQVAANCAFGGPNGDLLLIAATSSVWRLRLQTRGVAWRR
jgi:gluconolactonase